MLLLNFTGSSQSREHLLSSSSRSIPHTPDEVKVSEKQNSFHLMFQIRINLVCT